MEDVVLLACLGDIHYFIGGAWSEATSGGEDAKNFGGSDTLYRSVYLINVRH